MSCLWGYKSTDSITVAFVLTCLNPDGLCLSTLAVIPHRVRVLHALNSSSSPTDESTAGPRVTEASSQAKGKHYTITLTCSTAMVTYLMNKSRYQGPDNSDSAPLLLWQTSASLSIFLSLLLLFLYFSLSLFLTPLALAGRPTALTLFITRLWHFWIKLHTPHWLNSACESWEAQIIPLWFPVSHGIDGSGWSCPEEADSLPLNHSERGASEGSLTQRACQYAKPTEILKAPMLKIKTEIDWWKGKSEK